jgi:tRNA dimethylallyltransferase
MSRPTIVVVTGPTASRKSELASGLAGRLDGELVCCDSVQLVRGFRVGAAGPTADEMTRIPHHLYGVVDPDEPTDAGQYARMADDVIAAIDGRSRRPIVVGGTGLYLRALLEGLIELGPIPASVRERLQRELDELGNSTLFERLVRLDPKLAGRIEGGARNTQRMLRGLEVVEGTGQRLSDLHDAHQRQESRYVALVLMPCFKPGILAERIERRVDAMMEKGFLQEVRALLKAGISPSSRPMQSLGYRELIQVIQGDRSEEDAVRAIKQGHRKYAKRQRTWFRHQAQSIPLDGMSTTLVDDALSVLQERGL